MQNDLHFYLNKDSCADVLLWLAEFSRKAFSQDTSGQLVLLVVNFSFSTGDCFWTNQRKPIIRIRKTPDTKKWLNPFVPNALFFYPLKTSENLTVFWCFQGVEKGCIGNEWVEDAKIMPVILTKYQINWSMFQRKVAKPFSGCLMNF